MIKRILALTAVSALSFAVNLFAGVIEDEIDARLTPPGEVCVEGGECSVATAAVAGGGADRSGEEVYNASCMACHATGAAGAPILGDVGAWSARIGKGIDTLYDNALNGIDAMPAKGACMSCSDNEIKAVVDFMVEKSK